MRIARFSEAGWVVAVATALVLAGCGDKSEGRTGDGASVPADAGVLPASLKGYELYAWEEGGLLWFTLITGTNRLKTLDEITRKDVDQRDDFVHINKSGWDNLQAVLALVPRGTPIVLDGKIPGLPPLGEQSRDRILQMLRALGP